MNRDQARSLIRDTFTQPFDKTRFLGFVRNLLNHIDESKSASMTVPNAFKQHVRSCWRLGTYQTPDHEFVDVLIVHTTEPHKLERTRSALRDFVAHKLKRDDSYKEAGLVAFVSPDSRTWRFSYVRMQYESIRDSLTGRIVAEEKLTPARRFSYLVGEGESCHTAQTRFLGLLQETDTNPKLADIEEAFSVEPVSKEFDKKYRALFEGIEKELQKLVEEDNTIRDEFSAKGVNAVDFAKKLMGQIVFLYFLQKKGWLGVAKGHDWGTGPRDFLRRLARGDHGAYSNFFNDVLEPLFYDTLATDRGHEAWCNRFECRIPFLNGGLFEPLGDYDWYKTDIILPNRLFTNSDRIEEGVTGTGVLDVFDRYNFTVNEAEPLEREVAIDPEMLGRVFENLIEENRRKGLGAYYTPREIVHYMCQESLINYLDTALNTVDESVVPESPNQVGLFGAVRPEQTTFKTTITREKVPRADIETFVHLGDQAAPYEAARISGTVSYRPQLPNSIQEHARLIDDKLADITICDPAVGSGAFPVGMMNEIVRARSSLTPYFNDIHERTPYKFKHDAIQHSLYGADIDPGAVEIAKLRLWLSLVVDEEDVKQIKPLPNLDYKVVSGNSLVGFPFKSRGLAEIEKLKQDFFDETDHQKKAKLKAHIDKQIEECFAASEKSLGYAVSFDFEVLFSEVFDRRGGFDVVIANPPYLSAMEFSAKHSEAERKRLNGRFDTAKGAYDIYILFIEQGLRLLTSSGVLAFINPNKYLSAKYAEALRAYILENASLVTVLDVSGIRVFEQAAVYPVVSVMRKSPSSGETISLKLPRVRLAEIFELRNFSNKSVSSALLRALPEYIWGFLLSPAIDLLFRLISGTSNLSEVASINASSTAAEAAEYGEYIQERPSKDSLRLVNTGTIKRFHSLWGIKKLTHAGRSYATPYLALDPLALMLGGADCTILRSSSSPKWRRRVRHFTIVKVNLLRLTRTAYTTLKTEPPLVTSLDTVIQSCSCFSMISSLDLCE